MLNPVDPTTTPAWKRLTELHDTMTPDLRAWFADDPQRAERFSYELGDLYVDLSKNLLTDDVRDALVELAEQVDVPGRRDAMYAGEHINITEDRAVLHTALRRPAADSLTVDGQDVVADVHEVLEKIYTFARRVRSGEWTGITGKPIKTVVNIGIGGSDLGPVMVYEALKPYTTLETLTNARMARDWFLAALKDKGIETDGAIAKHFVAVSTALDKVAEFGIDPANAFGFWNWVGGRYSVDSAVGTVLAVAIGPENFADFLAGFHTVDEHFATKAPSENVPMLMGLLNAWYVNFFKAGSHAVLPYAQYLHRFPAYLQQLTMESNGKSVRWDGSPVTTETGEVFWGEPGTNGQHAFYQLIHQGTQLIPADFIAVANPAHPTKDGGVDVHELFLSNYLAQTAALAFGKTAAEVRAEGTPEEIVPARVFAGNKPTTSILAPALTPAVVGELIALYEHITFTQGIVWGIDSFDQWGVELGKKLALEIAPAVQGDEEALAGQDASTRGLITRYRGLRR